MKQPSSRSQVVQCADLDWQDNTPVSEQFHDVYFSRDSGEDETRFVFLQHNQLAERWNDASLQNFTIAETGFGTGLNFFCAAELWRQCKAEALIPQQAHLHFVSVEKFPLRQEDLEHACRQRPQHQWLSTELLAQYPAPVRGSHRLFFSNANITLTLLFDAAAAAFQQLEGLVDAWFLDGFAPAKNPDMWQPELFAQLARLSHPNTTFATFTAAGIVKRGLQASGFNVHKVPGFGRKREMLQGRFDAAPGADGDPHAAPELTHTEKPWFHFNYRKQCLSRRQTPGKAAVIGAGMAGATVAGSLARRGWQVSVFEKEDQIASQGSGNPSGITFTKLSLHDIPQNRFYQSAYLYACRYLGSTLQRLGVTQGKEWNFNGVLRLAYDAKEAAEQQALLDEHYWPESLLQGVNPQQIKDLTGLNTELHGIFLSGGGWLNPAALCQALLQQPGIDLHCGQAIGQLNREGNRWYLDNRGPFDAVVLASGFGSAQYNQTRYLPLRSVRGQISYIPQTETSSRLQHVINYQGYINPAREGFHCLGATFTPLLDTADERPEDHQWNCNQLADTLPDLAEMLNLATHTTPEGRVGFRCQTPDYLPVIGPIPDHERFLQQYADLGKGFLKRTFALGDNLPGLFVSCGHGSRGITSTCFGAEILASYVSGEPQIIDRDVLFSIHPARFLIRNIIRRSH